MCLLALLQMKDTLIEEEPTDNSGELQVAGE